MKLKMFKLAVVIVAAMLFVSQPVIVGAQAIQSSGYASSQLTGNGPSATSLSLTSGGELYVYGATSGGASPMSAFANGQTIQITNANGNASAELAVTTSPTNNYTTATSYNIIAGIGASGFNYAQAFYGLNPGPGPNLQASVSFTLSTPALVVVMGMGSSQPILDLSGLNNPTIDVAAENAAQQQPSLTIEHEYLSAGTYTIQVATADGTAAYQTPQDEVDLIGVLIFSTSPNAASSSYPPIPIPAAFNTTPAVSATLSSLTAVQSTPSGGGRSAITATVILRDINSNAVPGKMVTFTAEEIQTFDLAQTLLPIPIVQPVNPTDANGSTTVTFTPTAAGIVVVSAKDVTDEVTVQHVAELAFTPQLFVVPNSELSSEISSLDTASQSWLNLIASLSSEANTGIAPLGDYFWNEAVATGVDVGFDLGQSFQDLTSEASPCGVNGIDKIKDEITQSVITTTAQEGIAGAITLLQTQNNSSACNPANLFDTSSLEAVNGNPSSQLASQAGLESGQKIMAAAWLQERGQAVSIDSMTDSQVQNALYSGQTSLTETQNGLEVVAPGISCMATGLEQDLTARTAALLQGIAPMSEAQQAAWASDLEKRKDVAFVDDQIITQYQLFLQEMQAQDQQSQNSWFGQRGALAAWGFASAWAIFLDCGVYHDPSDAAEVFTSATQDLVNTYVDNSRLDTFEESYQTALNAVEMCFTYDSLTWLNEVAAFSQISAGMSPQTITGIIGTPVNNSIGYLGGFENGVSSILGGGVEQVSYSEIPIQNTSAFQGVFQVYVFYNHTGFYTGLGWPTFPLVATATATIDPGESETIKVEYTQQEQEPASPDAGSTVTIYVLGSDASGTFEIGYTSLVWPGNWLYESTSSTALNEKSASEGVVALQTASGSKSDSVTTIPNPIAASWKYSPSNQTYNVELTILNPFDLPLISVVTQAIPSNIRIVGTDGTVNNSNTIIAWTNVLQAYTNITAYFSFTCAVPYGSSFTLPACGLILHDPVSGSTLDAQGNPPQLMGSAPVQISCVVPNGTSGVASVMELSVTNLTASKESGYILISLTSVSGGSVYSATESFGLSAFSGSNISLTLPGSLLAGFYKVTASLKINEGTAPVFNEIYEVASTKPAITISAPASGTRWSNVVFVAWGTATGNGKVASVWYSLNNNAWEVATGTTNWAAAITLTGSATNTFSAYAVDSFGNYSPTNKVSFLYIPSATLTVQTNGLGGITPVDNGKLLAIGTNYTLTASPGKNWMFSNWVASGSEKFVSNNPVLNFTMQSNLVLQANFVTNPFLAVAGVYNGLFYPTNGVTEDSSGFISATIASNSTGAYTAKLLLDGGSNSFSGSFDLTGTAHTNLARSGKPPVNVTLILDFNPADAFLGGSVSNAVAGWNSEIHADRAVFSAAANPAKNYAGQFTLLLPPDASAPEGSPDGYGYAAITNTLAGISTLGGALADGTPFLWSVPIARNGGVPLYQSLYWGKGSLLGWIYFTNEPPQTVSMDSSVSWIKPSVPNTLYPFGFTNLTGVLGSPYTNTARAGVPVLNLTSATLLLTNGDLTNGFLIYTNIGTNLSSHNTLTNLDAGNKNLSPTNHLVIAINTNNGLVTVTFQETGAKTNTAHGAVLQNQTNAAGYFLGTNQSGAFLLDPR